MSNPYDQGVPPDWVQQYGQQPLPPGYGQPWGAGPIGETRSTGRCIFLFFITLGFYSYYWHFRVHDEMKRHTGQGLGGALAVVLLFAVGVASPFLVSDEVGKLSSARGQQPPVTATTGLWVFPGLLTLVGPFIWFTRTNRALNDHWVSLGAPPP